MRVELGGCISVPMLPLQIQRPDGRLERTVPFRPGGSPCHTPPGAEQ